MDRKRLGPPPPVDNYQMTLYTALQMLESGTTTVMYNHTQTPVATVESDVDEVLRAFNDAGMRVAFSVYHRTQNRVVYGDDKAFVDSLPGDLGEQGMEALRRRYADRR